LNLFIILINNEKLSIYRLHVLLSRGSLYYTDYTNRLNSNDDYVLSQTLRPSLPYFYTWSKSAKFGHNFWP